jgi:hypothetical protein
MAPADDSKCLIHKNSAKQEDYVVFYNERLKLFSTVKGLVRQACSIDQTYVAGELAQTKVYSGNLVLIANGKVMFFDQSGSVRELLSGGKKSYNEKGAFIQSLETTTKKGVQILKLVRRYSRDTGSTQEITIDEKDLKDPSRTAAVIESAYIQKEVEVKDGHNVFKVVADIIK